MDDLEYVDVYFLLQEIDNPDLDILKAIKCIAQELNQIKERQQYIMDLIPIKYKKFNPKPGENPFFSSNDIKGLNDPDERKKAKERMDKLLN